MRALVDAGVEEAFDLDFKITTYGANDEAKRDLAGDVAALANTAGGVVVVGIDEDAQGRAAAAPGVQVTDAEAVRMHQVIAANVAPMPTIHIKKVTDPGSAPAPGFYVIAVPPRPSAPHAVLINNGRGLRYPRRSGASIRYLSEPEVARAYRARDLGAAQQLTRAAEIAEEAVLRVPREEPWLLLTVVPDVAGDVRITKATFDQFKTSIIGSEPTVFAGSAITYYRAQVGPRSFIADDASQNRATFAHRMRLQVYSDGSGSYALRLHDTSRRREAFETTADDSDTVVVINDEWLAVALLSGLHRLGLHARDRAATSLDHSQGVRVESSVLPW